MLVLQVLKANDRLFRCSLLVNDTITSGCSEQGNGCSFVGNKDDANGAIEQTHLSIYPLSRPGLFRGAATGLFGSDLTQSVTSMVFIS